MDAAPEEVLAEQHPVHGGGMIELPEATAIAAQMRETLLGRTFTGAVVAEDRPRFLFVADDFASRLGGRRIEEVSSTGKWIFADLDDGEFLTLGEFGGRFLFHRAGEELPKNRHVTLELDGGGALTLAIQMWGFLGVQSLQERADHPYAGALGPCPIDPAFDLARWNEVLDTYLEQENKPVKAFLTHEANVCGIGNGYLQDILFRAHLSPKRKVKSLDAYDRASLYHAIRDTLEEAVDLGGRDTERTLFGEPGGYVPLLDKRANGKPCPRCGAPIEKIQYLGGSCYLCPSCQT
jgi:formamidopyrimidine-DNA glycosylase